MFSKVEADNVLVFLFLSFAYTLARPNENTASKKKGEGGNTPLPSFPSPREKMVEVRPLLKGIIKKERRKQRIKKVFFCTTITRVISLGSILVICPNPPSPFAQSRLTPPPFFTLRAPWRLVDSSLPLYHFSITLTHADCPSLFRSLVLCHARTTPLPSWF